MRKKKQSLSSLPVTAEVDKFSHDGRGITRIDGKTTFVENALPGETVTFEYIRKKRDFDEGQVLSVIEASPHRVEPRCPHYMLCGGCSLQHLDGVAQIHEKQKWLLDLLARVGHVEPETVLTPLTDSLWHYRNKARLSVRYVEKKKATLVGFREKNNPRYITEINQCPILHEQVDAHIPALRQMLDSLERPEHIAQIEVAAGDDEVALIFRNLSPLNPHDEDKLREFGRVYAFRIFLQPGGMNSVSLFYPEDGQLYLNYHLPKDDITLEFFPTDFTQVNAGLNRLMVDNVLNLLELTPTDRVLDLFCGIGNFSLPLAKHCAMVLGVEGSQEMVVRAEMNASKNHISNITFISQDLEDPHFLNRLQKENISKVLLDPPRAGALEIVKNIDKINPERLVYVSCNPATLARDADVLVNQQGYRMFASGVMDMFPHTAHVESLAVFDRRPD